MQKVLDQFSDTMTHPASTIIGVLMGFFSWFAETAPTLVPVFACLLLLCQLGAWVHKFVVWTVIVVNKRKAGQKQV